MTASMTAFARKELETEWGSLVWEIRSVNNRYLDAQFRLPETLRSLEGDLRETLRKQLSRGKVESTLFFRPSATANTDLQLNTELLQQLDTALQNTRALVQNTDAINPLELLRWPGVLAAEETDITVVKDAALKLYKEAATELIDIRQREGAALAELVNQRLAQITDIVDHARAILPTLLEQQQQKLQERIAKAQVEVDPTRLEQEIVLLLQKADVDEELDRLQTHVAEVSRILAGKGAVGRRLDFLMQELNREANTLGSKAVDTDITQSAVELKVLIEQMREQIQNIE